MRLLLRTLCLALLVFGLGLAALAHSPVGKSARPVAAPPAKRILILYQPDPNDPGVRLHAVFAANLAGRFGMAEMKPLDGYRSGGAEGYAAVLIIGSPKAQANAALAADLAAGARPAIWFGRGADALAGRFGWAPDAPAPAARSVTYKGREFERDPNGGPLIPVRATTAQVLAQTPDGKPWALRSGGFTYVADMPFGFMTEDDRYLIAADLLFDALAPETPERHRAMVRIEDVGPDADPAKLRHIADVLHAAGVPFSVAVYDSYRDPDGAFSFGIANAFTLRKRGALVDALSYMAERGGTLVMHGHTHQSDQRKNPYAKVSAGDYEFFAADLDGDGAFKLDGPLKNDTVEAWTARLDEGLAVWRDVGLPRPTIFTTPHYAASPNAYRAIAGRFGVRYERVIYFGGDPAQPNLDPEAWGGQFFPYPVRDIRGDVILPENLGYYSSKDTRKSFGRDATALVEAARRNLAVRDGYASFFFHWYEDPKALTSTVQALQGMGYRFVGPAEVLNDAPAHFRAAPEAQALPGPTPLWIVLYRLADRDALVAALVLAGFLGLVLETLTTGRRRPARA